MEYIGCVNRLRGLRELKYGETEDAMDGDARDQELEWLNVRTELSNREVARILGVHYEVVRRARLTRNLGDSLRQDIRAYIEEHFGGSEEGSQLQDEARSSEGDADGHAKTTEPGATSESSVRRDGEECARDAERPSRKRRHLNRGSRGGRRATEDLRSDDSGEQERRDTLRLVDEIVACESAEQVAAITARIRARHLQRAFQKRDNGESGSSRPFPLAPYYTYPGRATPDELKTYALALLSEVPVLKELPLVASVSAARAALRGEVSLLDPPPLLYGDAALLLAMRVDAGYRDAGAREVAFAPAGRLYACGLRAEELRDGITIEERMRRYYRDEHRDRPRLIGLRFSDVIPERPYPDEDFFFGSDGWTDADGEWRPGRAELIARWRHVASLYEDWQADRPTTLWQHALSSVKAELELTLLTPEYAMTFERGILGDARWPTSTRLGHETQARVLLLRGNDQATGMLRRHRMLSRLLLWLPRILLRGIDWLLRAPPPLLNGSVCGKRVWKATDPPLTPDYATPHPVSGYVPSRAFRLRFRRHEFEHGWAPPPPDAAPPGRLVGTFDRLAAGIRSATGRTGNAH